MSVDAGTVPELAHHRLDTSGTLMTVEAGSSYDELREKLISGEVKLNFSYLPPRPIELKNLNIGPAARPLVDPNKTPERIIYL
jgi:hypothetical protein